MTELCPFCRSDVKPHCRNGHPTCTWVRCERCAYTIDPKARRAYDKQSQQIPWPFSEPERGSE